jgi:hypothetical protein
MVFEKPFFKDKFVLRVLKRKFPKVFFIELVILLEFIMGVIEVLDLDVVFKDKSSLFYRTSEFDFFLGGIV